MEVIWSDWRPSSSMMEEEACTASAIWRISWAALWITTVPCWEWSPDWVLMAWASRAFSAT